MRSSIILLSGRQWAELDGLVQVGVGEYSQKEGRIKPQGNSSIPRRGETRRLVPTTTGLSERAPKKFCSGVMRSLRTMSCGANLGPRGSLSHSRARERHTAGLEARASIPSGGLSLPREKYI